MTLLPTDPDDVAATCRALVVDYHLAIDRGRATAGISAFDEHAEFEVRGRVLRGRQEILGFLTDREGQRDRHTVHVIANESVVESGDDRVELQALVLLYVRGADGRYPLEKVLDTRHTFHRVGGAWLISRRTSTPLHPA